MIYEGKNWKEVRKDAIEAQSCYRIDIMSQSKINKCICYDTREEEREILIALQSYKPQFGYDIFFMEYMIKGCYNITQHMEVRNYD